MGRVRLSADRRRSSLTVPLELGSRESVKLHHFEKIKRSFGRLILLVLFCVFYPRYYTVDMSSFYFLRHGESVLNTKSADIVGGRSNYTELTESGRQQAGRAGRWILAHHLEPDFVMSSPALRTLQTAEEALGKNGMDLPLDIIVKDDIQELSQGVMEGEPRNLVWTPEVKEELSRDRGGFKFVGGESINEVQERMLRIIEKYGRSHDNTRYLMVGHGIAIRSLVGLLTENSQDYIINVLKTSNCSLTAIHGSKNNWDVEYVGRDIAS